MFVRGEEVAVEEDPLDPLSELVARRALSEDLGEAVGVLVDDSLHELVELLEGSGHHVCSELAQVLPAELLDEPEELFVAALEVLGEARVPSCFLRSSACDSR